MQMIKYFMLFFILVACSLIGRYLSKKYVIRVNELEEMKNALNMFQSKIKFTYDPIPQIFEEISKNTSQCIGNIFLEAKQKMQMKTANIAWEEAIEESQNSLTKEDKHVLKTLSKLLGQTDVEGQTSQIEITQKFLETQLQEAQEQRIRNEKLYSKLGTTIGLAIVIILC
jgi:stage III sporulation protein AB